MSVSEQNALIRAKDVTGNSFLIYPITKAENVDGLDELIDKTQPADYVINATYDMATVDKAYDDIVAAYNAGSHLVLYHDGEKFDFVAGGPGEFVFEKINIDSSNGVTVARASIYGQDNYLYRAEYKKFDNSETVPITKGGTGATTAADALTNIGAAPAGLVAGNYSVTSDTEIDAALETVLSAMSNNTARYIRLSCNPAGVAIDGRYWLTLVYKYSDAYATVTASSYSLTSEGGQIKKYERSKVNGTWQDWYEPKTNTSLAGVITSGDGAAYTATVSGITSLTAGVSFTMIPHVVSTSTSPTLDVNGLGAKNIRRRLSSSSTSTAVGYAAAWLGANKPIKVEYDGTYWIADLPKPSASDLSGTLPIANGGTGATTASTALANLGAAPNGLISATYTVASDTEIDTALNTELNKMSASTAHHVSLHVSAQGLSLPAGLYEVFIFKTNDDYAFARATRYGIDSLKLINRERSKSGGTWLSWYNPNDYTMEYGEREQIPSGTDLNDYVSIGNYACLNILTASSLSNCPTTNAFILNVFSSIGDDTKTPASGSTGYYYYIQELIDINAQRWVRLAWYLGSYWSFGTWEKIITSAGGTITGSLAVTDDIKLQKTISGKTYLSRIYDDPDSGVYSAFGRYVDGELKNYIALYDDYTIIRTPLKLTSAHYGSSLPSSGVAGQLFFKI